MEIFERLGSVKILEKLRALVIVDVHNKTLHADDIIIVGLEVVFNMGRIWAP